VVLGKDPGQLRQGFLGMVLLVAAHDYDMFALAGALGPLEHEPWIGASGYRGDSYKRGQCNSQRQAGESGRKGHRLSTPYPGRYFRDLTVGVAGCGRIGRAVVHRIVPFGCRLLVFDPAVGAADIEAMGAHAVSSLADLLAGSDVVTLHCPSTEQTRRMINAYRRCPLRSVFPGYQHRGDRDLVISR
jgi:hypothetical protein